VEYAKGVALNGIHDDAKSKLWWAE
jgi:hypothetical protein